MSKLSDRIRRAARSEPAAFGFTAVASRAKTPSLLTIVRLASSEAGKAGDAAKAGADAVIVSGDAGKLKDAGQAALGAAPDKTDRKTVAALRDAGADFVVITREALAEGLLEERVGFVLDLREELEDTQLRLLGELSLDAIIVPAPNSPVTVDGLLGLRRIAALGRAPLLVEDDGGADATYLQLLRDSGVAGLVVGAAAIGKLGELRSSIERLPPRGKRREQDRDAPLVPAQARSGHEHDDDDYDD
jgi:hypothetical protein